MFFDVELNAGLLKNYWDFILWSNLAPPLKFHWHINSLIDPIKILPQRFHRFTDRHCRYLVDVEFDRWHRWWRIYHWRYKCKVVMICEYLMLLPQFTWNDQCGDLCDKKFVDLNSISRLIVYIFLLYHTKSSWNSSQLSILADTCHNQVTI